MQWDASVIAEQRERQSWELRELCTRVPIPNDTHNLTQLQAHSLSHTESSTQERASSSSRSQFPYVWVPLALATYPHMYDNKPVFRFHVISATNEKFKSKTQIKYICMLRKKKRYKRSKEPVTQIQIGKQKHRRKSKRRAAQNMTKNNQPVFPLLLQRRQHRHSRQNRLKTNRLKVRTMARAAE